MLAIDNVPKNPDLIGGFWQEFGRLMAYYAGVEEQMNFIVRHYYKIILQTSNMLLGDLRTDNAIVHLNRLNRADLIPETDWETIGVIKEQLGSITRLRNDLVHYGVAYSVPAGYVVISKWRYTEERKRNHVVSVNTLDDATHDLFKIFQHLVILHRPHERVLREMEYGELLREPWRYKPLALGSLYPALPSNHQARQNPPPPSQT